MSFWANANPAGTARQAESRIGFSMAVSPYSVVSINRAERPLFRLAAATGLLALTACGVPIDRSVTVRHFASTETAGNGARWHIFLFGPSEARSLDQRIALARGNLAPGCNWVGAPRPEIARRTAEQGARYTDAVLAAPLRCDI